MPRTNSKLRNHLRTSFANRKLPMAIHQKAFSMASLQSRVLTQDEPLGKTLAVDQNFIADVDEYYNARRVSVRLQLTCTTAPVQLGPLAQLFDMIQCYTGSDPKDAFRTYRGDELLCFEGLARTEDNDANARKDSNFYGIRGQYGDTLAINEVRDFYIDLPAFPLERLSADHAGEFRMKFNLRKGCVLSGSAANVEVTGFDIILVEQGLLNGQWEQSAYNKSLAAGFEKHYVDSMLESKSAETFTASVEKKINFTADGFIVGHAVMLRPTGYESSGGSALTNFRYLGEDALISITRKGHGDKNILTEDGSTVTVRELQRMDRIKWSEDSNVLFIPYSTSMVGDISGGTHSGVRYFGEEMTLRITPAAAVTDAVFTFNCTNAANDGGSYRLIWGGESTAVLAFDANVAAMKAAFEALRVCKENDLEVTFSATAASDFTMTVSNANCDVAKKWGNPGIDTLTLADGGTIEICDVTNTTQYRDGSNVGGASLDVDILSWNWRRLGFIGGHSMSAQL